MDLTEAGDLFRSEDNAFGVAQTLHGLGWAQARRGDLPQALQHLDESAAQFGALGHEALEVDVDRVEVLLSAGLCVEAADLARKTATRLSAAGNHSQAGEVWLLCARAALLDGDRTSAATYAERARTRFQGQNSSGWEQAALLEVHRSRDIVEVTELRVLADKLDAAGNAKGAATALGMAAAGACEAEDFELARLLVDECLRRARRLGVFEVRMLARHAAATCAAAHGNLRGARQHVKAGLSDLRQHRASLAASDARASVATHATQLSLLGLRLSMRSGSAPAVLEWMERARAGRGRFAPPRPPEDDVLAADLIELRSVSCLLRSQETDAADTGDLTDRQRGLELSIHHRQLRLRGDGLAETPIPGMSQLRDALNGGTLLEFAEVDGRMVGVDVGVRRSRLADIGGASELAEAMTTARSALKASVASGGSSGARASRLELLRRALAVLDAAVAGLLSGEGPVVLVLPPAAHAVPWHLVPCLVGRPVVVAPSATWWHDVQSVTDSAPARSAAVVAGPRLLEAEREACAVAECYSDARLLTGSAATSAAVMAALASVRVAHVASHGRIRHDNPLWSSLELFDGPLCVYDLERLPRTPPLVVLSGCDTGVGVRAGDELLGLATTLLDHGTRSLVASVCILPDTPATRETMTSLHQRVSGGESASGALAALSANATREEGSLIAACLACFGTH